MQNEIWGAALVTLLLASPALTQQALHCDGLDPAKPGHATRAYECVSKLSNDLAAALTRLEALEAIAHPIPEIPRIPAGAIVASESECKTLDGGWSTYTPATARVIVGAGDEFHPKHREWLMQLPTGGFEPRVLPDYRAESGGGELEVMLTEAQMPKHSHRMVWGQQNGNPEMPASGNNIPTLAGIPIQRTLPEGGSQPHSNMPPYIALYFCRRTDASPRRHCPA